MKRTAALLLCIFLLSGCRSRAAAFVPKTAGFSCTADIETAETAFSCSLSVEENGVLTATLSAPCSYEGLTVRVDESETTVTYREQTAAYPNDRLPGGFFAGAIAELLKNLPGDTAEESENGYVFRGVSSRGDYSLCFTEDGFPCLLTLPQEGLTVIFRDFQNLAKND